VLPPVLLSLCVLLPVLLVPQLACVLSRKALCLLCKAHTPPRAHTLPCHASLAHAGTQVTNGTAQDVEFTIEWEQLSAWIADVKRIIQKDLFEDGKAP
jgi:hypothetical protein